MGITTRSFRAIPRPRIQGVSFARIARRDCWPQCPEELAGGQIPSRMRLMNVAHCGRLNCEPIQQNFMLSLALAMPVGWRNRRGAISSGNSQTDKPRSAMMRAASSSPDATGISQQLEKYPGLWLFHLLSTPLRNTALRQSGGNTANAVLRPAATLLFPGWRRDIRDLANDQGTPKIPRSQLTRRSCRMKSLSAFVSSATRSEERRVGKECRSRRTQKNGFT